ncbi:MAG: aldo/keto reductase [Actinobacteria bacterium]|nr:aldo/keto reductase [Actinomycetota bacterium]
MVDQPYVTLNTGGRMPQLGYGVWQIPDVETEAAVCAALSVGYRSIDTATLYRNEAEVGRGLNCSQLAREDLFVTTKLWNSEQGYDKALRAFDRSLELLGLDYLDLYLIHWPAPQRNLYVESWRALEKIHADGRARNIGVSNFTVEQLQRLIDESSVVPAVNQIELSPYLTQSALRAFHEQHGIVTEAWAPLARGGELLIDPTINALADKYDKTPAQIVLAWHIALGNVAIPKSVRPERISENFEIFDVELDNDDVEAITELNRNERTGADPDQVN